MGTIHPIQPTPVKRTTVLFLPYTHSHNNKHVWTRKGRQGTRQGRREASPQDLARQHPGYHQARYPPTCATWRCRAYLWSDLRGDPWCPQDLPRERHPRLRYLHRARQAQDRHLPRCRLRSQAPGPNPLRFRRISVAVDLGRLPSLPGRALFGAHPLHSGPYTTNHLRLSWFPIFDWSTWVLPFGWPVLMSY